jgi:hypothetical protein
MASDIVVDHLFQQVWKAVGTETPAKEILNAEMSFP